MPRLLVVLGLVVLPDGTRADLRLRGRPTANRDLASAVSLASADRAALQPLRQKYGKGLGALVPIAALKSTLEAKIASGTLPAGQKLPDDLGERKCPAGAGPADCVAPIVKYEGILPGLDAYIDYIWKRVDMIKTANDPVAALYNFGCREISRHMPGFARITQVRVSKAGGAQTAGDWEAPISNADDALERTDAGPRNDPKGSSSKYQGPPKKDDVVEVCEVTHLQLEETLRKDLALLVKGRSGKATEDPVQIRGTADVLGVDAENAMRVVRAKLKLADGKLADDVRLVDLAQACRLENKSTPVAESLECDAREGGRFRPDFDLACRRQHGRSLGVDMRARLIGPPPKVSCTIKKDDLNRLLAEELLKQDLGVITGQNHLKGETFRAIAGRVSGFFRKAGKARVFEDNKEESKDHVRLPNPPLELKADVDNQNASAPQQTDRESLRLKVDQWTDAWEYRTTTRYFETGPAPIKNAFATYKAAEKLELNRFWTDCNEINAVCQSPKTANEIEACARCALEALFDQCVDGKRAGDNCREKAEAKYPKLSTGQPNPATAVGTPSAIVSVDLGGSLGTRKFTFTELPTGNTVFNWAVGRAIEEAFDTERHRKQEASDQRLDTSVRKVLRVRRFFPFGSKILSSQGRQVLDQLPISPWQKCFLLVGEIETCRGFVFPDGRSLNKDGIKKFAKIWMDANTSKSPLWNAIFSHPQVKEKLEEVKKFWRDGCSWKPGPSSGPAPKVDGKPLDCNPSPPSPFYNQEHFISKLLDDGAAEIANERNAQGGSSQSGAGAAVAGGVSSVVGTILGIILQATGLEDLTKTLAQASGLSPEQSFDCEDAEYRKETLGLSGSMDNKLACLTKVFLKNFGTSLESIIVMLGNRTVDLVLNILKMALKGVKATLLSSAAAVPFAGSILVQLVEVAWWLVFDFGIKALLKGVVVANLPKWLKLKELSTGDPSQIEINPVLAVVIGFVLDMIQSASQYGSKGPVQAAFAAALTTIETILANIKPPPSFWIRALIFSKRAIVANSREGMSVGDQFKEVIIGMIEGFKVVIAERIENLGARGTFTTAVGEIQNTVRNANFAAFQGGLTNASDKGKYLLKFIVDFLATKIFPSVVPIITAFVPMPEIAKTILNTIATSLSSAVAKLRSGSPLTPAEVGAWIAGSFGELGKWFLAQIPASGSVKTLIEEVYNWIVWVIGNISQFKTDYIDNPWAFVTKIVGWIRPFVENQLAAFISDVFGFEKTLVTQTIARLFDFLTDDAKRGAVFGGTDVNANVKAILANAVDVAKPYLIGRLKNVAAGTGLEPTIENVLSALLGPNGPFVKGKVFFDSVPTWLATNGNAILGEVATAVKEILKKKATDAGASPVVVAIADAVVTEMVNALVSLEVGGLTALAGKGAVQVVKLAKRAMGKVVDAVVNIVSAGSPTIGGHVRTVLGGLVELFANPQRTIPEAQAAWTAFTNTVGSSVRALLAWMVQGVTPTIDVSKVVFNEATVAAIIVQVVERVVGGNPVMPVLKTIIEKAVHYAANPSELASLLPAGPGGAKAVWMQIRGVVSQLLDQLIGWAVRDLELKPVVVAAKGILLSVFDNIGATAQEIGNLVKGKLAEMIPVLMTFLKAKVVPLFPASLVILKDLVIQGLDWLGTFVVSLLANGPNAWNQLTLNGASGVVSGIVDKVLGVAKAQIARVAPAGAVTTFINALIDAAGGFVKNAKTLATTFSGSDVKKKVEAILVVIAPAVRAFLTAVVVNKVPEGVAKTVVTFLVNQLCGLLEKPADLIAFIDKVKSGGAAGLAGLKTMVMDLVTGPFLRDLASLLDAKAKTIADILRAGIDYVKNNGAAFFAP
ncbi:MAG: hypothetical protein HYY84_10175 [Deltaproteobacteria bacterium]|nr:hypothetical protein [Deltaproteobacteria bacterium]